MSATISDLLEGDEQDTSRIPRLLSRQLLQSLADLPDQEDEEEEEEVMVTDKDVELPQEIDASTVAPFSTRTVLSDDDPSLWEDEVEDATVGADADSDHVYKRGPWTRAETRAADILNLSYDQEVHNMSEFYNREYTDMLRFCVGGKVSATKTSKKTPMNGFRSEYFKKHPMPKGCKLFYCCLLSIMSTNFIPDTIGKYTSKFVTPAYKRHFDSFVTEEAKKAERDRLVQVLVTLEKEDLLKRRGKDDKNCPRQIRRITAQIVALVSFTLVSVLAGL